jgi:hypothetical protein
MKQMRKQAAIICLFLLVFGGAASAAVARHSSSAEAERSAAIRQEQRLGPKPLPHWYWRWLHWRLTKFGAVTSSAAQQPRPERAPHRIPRWAWRRMHFFLLARELAGTGGGGAPLSNGGPTYRQAISYTKTRPSFTPQRTIMVSNAAKLRSAISNLRPGDLVKASSGFTVAGETIISNRLSAPAELDLTGVHFVYSGGRNLPAVWLDNARNLYIYGGNATTSDSGGACIVDYGSQHVLWWGFSAHGCGGSGFAASTTNGDAVDHNDFQGTIWKVGQNLHWDPHSEKGTGLHGAILWDSQYTSAFTNNRFAFSLHNIPTGACVELGNNEAAQAGGNVLYEKCVDASDVAKVLTGGNGLQLWGETTQLGLDVKYLQVDDAQGRALESSGIYSGQNLHGVTVEYGTASHTNQNHDLTGSNNRLPWDTYGGVVYKQVFPAR